MHLDSHLYTPLIIWKKNKEEIKSIPVKLNKGETDFVRDLRDFLNKNKDLLMDKEIFLLRNLSRKGVGFFLSAGFYPDFIIWINDEKRQHMVFIDPKGIRNLGNFDDDKIQLCTSFIKEIEKRVNNDLKNKGETVNLQLDAFIISVSHYEDIKKIFGTGKHSPEEFENHNILFQKDENYILKILEKIKVITKDDINNART